MRGEQGERGSSGAPGLRGPPGPPGPQGHGGSSLFPLSFCFQNFITLNNFNQKVKFYNLTGSCDHCQTAQQDLSLSENPPEYSVISSKVIQSFKSDESKNTKHRTISAPRYYTNEPTKGAGKHPLGYNITNEKEKVKDKKQNDTTDGRNITRGKLKLHDPYDTKRIQKYNRTKINDRKNHRPLRVSPPSRKNAYSS